VTSFDVYLARKGRQNGDMLTVEAETPDLALVAAYRAAAADVGIEGDGVADFDVFKIEETPPKPPVEPVVDIPTEPPADPASAI
jgi:hypothetical protein